MAKQLIKNIVGIKSFMEVLEKDPVFHATKKKDEQERQKQPFRYDIINFLLEQFSGETSYLEIGVRNPAHNFDRIKATHKISVDPGIEFKENPVDFKLTSDAFFDQLAKGELDVQKGKFDVIFIDGLHLADQVYTDIRNALNFLDRNGFIVVHDCNPPTEYHAREDHNFTLSPAFNSWNGSVWKAFYKLRMNSDISCCCIDTDWGVGIITKRPLAKAISQDFNPFFEFHIFNERRKESLNLMEFETFRKTLENS